jgi:prepilin-type N-terminal cleavage/methylation domain-containing protein/prepilin-type processing-associated H-X9-DG protein
MKRAGFTLIELLVVIGILSLLMAITSSGAHYVRQRAKATICQYNIRALCLGLVRYSLENDRFPRGLAFTLGDTVGSLTSDLPTRWWFQDIGEQPKRFDAVDTPLRCPSKQLDPSSPLKHNILWANYGVNWSICSSLEPFMPRNVKDFARSSLSYGRVKSPSRVLLIADSGYGLIGWQHAASPVKIIGTLDGPLATSYIPGLSTNKERELHLVQNTDAIEGRHPEHTVNVGYVDGHVEKRKADDLLVEQTEEGNYTNRNSLWNPR